jgi:TP901 family phage tail tape measure protein
MAQLRDAAIQAGADTAFSAEEAAKGIEELAKAGVSTKDILNGGLMGALSLAAAGEMSVGDAAEIAATALTQFKLEGKDIPHVADLLAAGAGKAQGSVQDLGMALKQSGLVASQYGLSIEETVGGLAAFASAGLIGSDAGTSFKTMLQSLTPTSKQAQAKMDELGFSAFDASGNMKSLSAIADNLRQSMHDLTPEQRNAAMSIIFGSDAVRAASVLYENGADGIQKWIDNVNDAGYAALTASMNQNNLAGDLEKLHGSIDSVFLKSASGVNDVLRSWAQGANGLVDAIGSIPAPLLNVGLGVTGVIGGMMALAGVTMTIIPKVVEARQAWDTFSESNGKLAGALGTTAKIAGIAAIALVGLQVMGAITDQFRKAVPKVDDFNSALKDIKAGSFDPMFKGFIANVNGVGDAFVRLGNSGYDHFNDQVGIMISGIPGLRQPIADLKGAVDGLDTSMSGLTKNGGMARAAEGFKLIQEQAAKSADAQGKAHMSAMDILNMMPQYKAALQDQARSLGDSASDTELLEMAQGKIPPRLQMIADMNGKAAEAQKIQAGVSEDQAKALADLGLNVDGSVASFGKLLDAMFSIGNSAVAVTQTESAWQDMLDGLKAKIDGVIASQSAHNHILNDTKTAFDLTNPAGRDAAAVFDEIQQKGTAATAALANNGAQQDVLSGKLHETYDNLVAAAGRFGITGQAADAMARSVLGIPPGVDINTAINNYADTMAKLNGVQSKANEVNGTVVGIHIQYTESGTAIRDRASDAGNLSGKWSGFSSGGKVQGFATGGKVNYLAVGGPPLFRPNGTDTVPAMLTPGEVVIKRSSARAIGYETLARANATGSLGGSGGKSIDASTNIHGDVYTVDTKKFAREMEQEKLDSLAMIGVRV